MSEFDPRRYVLRSPAGDGLRGTPTPISIVTADGTDLLASLASSGAPVPTLARRGTLAVLGDSISSYDQAGQPDRVTHNWLGILSVNSSQRIRHAGIFGTGGFTLANIRDTHLPQVLALDPLPEAVCIAGGTNDVSDQAAGIAALNDIIAALKGAGIRPVLWLVPPRDDESAGLVSVWNAKVRVIAQTGGYQVVDAYSPVASPASGKWAAGDLHLDAVHPSGKGHAAIAAALLATPGWVDRFDSPQPYLATSSIDSANLIPYGMGLFGADSNGDGIADGWSNWGSSAYTASLVTDSNGFAWQRLTKASGNSDQGGLQLDTGSGFSAGDRVALTARVRASRSDINFVVSFEGRNSGGNPIGIRDAWDSESTGGVTVDGIVYGEGIVPDGRDTLRVNLQIRPNAPAATAYVEFSRVTIINLTALGVA